MPNPEESFTKIDVPADGSCLFWAVALAYLTPVKNNDALFRQRYEALFGNGETATRDLDHIKSLVQSYNTYDGTFVDLVRNIFRSRVVDHIRSHENEFRAFVEGESGRSFDDYLQDMKNPNTWGGEPEIRAMSTMLGADISVSGASSTRYTNGDIQIQLFHVGTPDARNHYNFGLERHIVNDNEVGQLQNSLKESIKHYQTEPQDFELIQLLIQEADSVNGANAGTSTQQREDFEARFQSYIDQIPSYLHSVGKPGFFPNFFLGSFSTLLDTEVARKLDINKIYFDFDGAKTLKVAVIKNGEINSQKDVIDKVKLFVISESGSRPYTQEFDQGELQEVLGEHYSLVENNLGEIKVKFVGINKDNINDQGISVTVEDKKVDTHHTSERQFTEIKKGLWGNSEGDIAKLADSDAQEVKKSLGKVLNRISAIHSEYESSLEYASRAREAAHHGFIAGALNNFRYRYNLRVYLEQFAGRGYADIVLLVRGPGRALDSIPVIMEIKVATAQEIKRLKELKELEKSRKLTKSEEDERNKIKENIEARSSAALEQARGYAKGFQPNVQRVLTTADDILYVVVNFDSPSPISNIEAVNREERIIPLFEDMLKSTDDWYNDAEEVGKRELKKQIKDNLERIYHTFPGTGEKGDNYYFSRFLLGQSLLLNKALGAKFEKRIFIYDRDENIPTEIHPESGRPQRPAAQKAKDKLSTGLDKSHAVVSMVLIPESTEKLVYVINIVEANRKDVLNKVLPLDRLNQKIGDRKIVELNLNFDTRYKSNFERYLTVEASDPVSLEQYNERGIDEFQGTFREVPYSDQLKEAFDRALDSQRTQSSSIDKYNELFKKIGEGIWPFKTLIGKENDFQGVLNGIFSYYSDLKLQESPETRALVLTEFQTGRGERVDMLVHGIKFEGDAKEHTPIGLELKASRQGKGAKALLKEANDQINKEYKEGVTYKTLTDGDEVEFIGVVFNKGAKDADSLILTSEKSIPVKVVHSSTHVLPTVGQCSKERKKRNIGMACVDSRDEEDITKEEKERRIKELLSDEMIMKIKLKELESKINDEVLSRYEEIESVATYDINKSDVLSNALQSLKLSKMILLMSQKSEVSIELQEKAYYNALIDIGALIHDHKNYVHGDHLSALEGRVQGNQLFSVAHDLCYLSKNKGNIDQDKLYSDHVKSKISLEDENGLDDIHSKFSDTDIKSFFSDSDVKDFYAEAQAYDKEVITIHSTQVFAEESKVYMRVKDSDDNVMIGDIASIQNTENYILDEETSKIKLRVDGDKEYTITQELEEEHVKHYLNIPGGHKVKVGNIINSFTEDIKEAIHSKLDRLELLASKKDIEEISNAEVTDQDYNDVLGEIKQSLLQKGVSEGTFNQLKDHLDSLGEKVFAEYISDVEKKLEGHGIEFDRNKFDSAKVKGTKSGKFFSLMAIYDLFDSISDVPTLGRHDNDALKKIFGINGILDAMDDVRESLSASYIRSDGKAVTKIPRDSAIGKVISKIPDPIRKTFVKIINNPVVQSITFATIAYQFGYSINEIVKGNHHPLNYYWTASSGIKLASMSIKPISIGVSSTMKGISATTKVLRGLSAASKVLSKASIVTTIADFAIVIGIAIHERVEYTKAIAEQLPLNFQKQLEIFFAKIAKPFTGKDIGEEYEDKLRIRNYLNQSKNQLVDYLSFSDMAAVVWYIPTFNERYDEIIETDTREHVAKPENEDLCILRKEDRGAFFGAIDRTWDDLSLLNISEIRSLKSHIVEGKKVYFIDDETHYLPYISESEYNDGLRVVRAPLGEFTRTEACSKAIYPLIGRLVQDYQGEQRAEPLVYKTRKIKDPAISQCNNGNVHRNCSRTFTFPGEPFIFASITRNNSSPILYLSGPDQLIAAANYPAVMYVPRNSIHYTGSLNHSTIFVISDFPYWATLQGGKGQKNTMVVNIKTNNIHADLYRGTVNVDHGNGGAASLFNVYNFISDANSTKQVITHCETRFVNATNAKVWQGQSDCQDQDYEIRKVNAGDLHYRGLKHAIFIVDQNSDDARVISSFEGPKKNIDIISVQGTDISKLRVSENAKNNKYELSLLANNGSDIVSSIRVDSFKNLVIQVEHYGITKTIIVQDKSLPDIIKGIEYQKLNHSGTNVDSKIIEDGKKRSKAIVLANITGLENLTAYEVAKDIINNNNLGIPISLVQIEKVMGDVAHEAVVENVYPDKIVADFSRGNINCKKVITVEMEPQESECVVKFPQAYECDHPVNFTLRVINNPSLYARASDKVVDLTECNINLADIKCRADGEYAAGIILNSCVNQGSFRVVLDSYLRGPEYQHIAFQFNKGGGFYKVNGASLKLEPVLLYEEKIGVDYDSLIYYKPDEQGLQIYHNQPNNNNKIGFVDLKGKSILDSNMEIVNGSLVLLHDSNTFMEVVNWNITRLTRKMMFAFNDTTISDLECLFLTCNPEGIVQKFIEEKKVVLEAKLFDAVKQGNLNTVKNLVRLSVDINVQCNFGNTLLHYASSRGNLDIIEYLIESGADIKIKNKRGQTAIFYASFSGNQNITTYLVEKGADINVKDIMGCTAVCDASNKGALYAVKSLVESKADIHIADNLGRTPLWHASQRGHLKVVEYLASERANVNAEDRYGEKPRDVAIRYRHTNVVKYLEKLVEEKRGKPVQRKRRHHNYNHNHSSYKFLSIGSSNQPEIATSNAARPSSWINDLFSWAKGKGSLLVSGVVNSVWPASVAKLSEETSYGFITKNNLEPIDYSQIDMHGTILLLDTFIRKITGQKYISTAGLPISSLEAQGYALNVTEGFKKVVEQSALKSGISMHRLNIDFMEIRKEITGKIMSDKFNEIPGTLNSYVEKACPGKEVGCPGKLSLKKFGKFMTEFNKRLDVALNQPMQQVLNRDSTLKASNVKERQISLEPKSYLSDTSVQGHLTQDRGLRN